MSTFATSSLNLPKKAFSTYLNLSLHPHTLTAFPAKKSAHFNVLIRCDDPAYFFACTNFVRFLGRKLKTSYNRPHCSIQVPADSPEAALDLVSSAVTTFAATLPTGPCPETPALVTDAAAKLAAQLPAKLPAVEGGLSRHFDAAPTASATASATAEKEDVKLVGEAEMKRFIEDMEKRAEREAKMTPEEIEARKQKQQQQKATRDAKKAAARARKAKKTEGETKSEDKAEPKAEAEAAAAETPATEAPAEKAEKAPKKRVRKANKPKKQTAEEALAELETLATPAPKLAPAPVPAPAPAPKTTTKPAKETTKPAAPAPAATHAIHAGLVNAANDLASCFLVDKAGSNTALVSFIVKTHGSVFSSMFSQMVVSLYKAKYAPQFELGVTKKGQLKVVSTKKNAELTANRVADLIEEICEDLYTRKFDSKPDLPEIKDETPLDFHRGRIFCCDRLFNNTSFAKTFLPK